MRAKSEIFYDAICKLANPMPTLSQSDSMPGWRNYRTHRFFRGSPAGNAIHAASTHIFLARNSRRRYPGKNDLQLVVCLDRVANLKSLLELCD
ncbi:MAG: hypothetical protein JWM30_2778 [Burkholderia sp.]|jgi:hypothetical protein|nr:hypothetical protein [Burkholderia sp.]